MAKVALQADLWYNKPINIVLPQRCWKHPVAWKHLDWRCFMNTLSHHAQDDNVPEKRCSKCKQYKPATTEFFYREKRHPDGLRSDCKACGSTSKRPVLPEGLKHCNYCDRTLPATSEYFDKRKASKDGLQPKCRDCRKDYDTRNREQHRERSRAYYAIPENKERHRARDKARRNDPETREQVLANKRTSWARRKDHIKEYYKRPEVREMKRTNERNRSQDPIKGKILREQKRIRTLNRLARKKAVSGTYTSQQIQEQLKHQDYRCYYAACGHARFEKRNGRYIYHIDHTFPISRVAGTDIPANSIDYLVLTCPSCNMSKGDKFPWEWPEGGRLF